MSERPNSRSQTSEEEDRTVLTSSALNCPRSLIGDRQLKLRFRQCPITQNSVKQRASPRGGEANRFSCVVTRSRSGVAGLVGIAGVVDPAA